MEKVGLACKTNIGAFCRKKFIHDEFAIRTDALLVALLCEMSPGKLFAKSAEKHCVNFLAQCISTQIICSMQWSNPLADLDVLCGEAAGDLRCEHMQAFFDIGVPVNNSGAYDTCVGKLFALFQNRQCQSCKGALQKYISFLQAGDLHKHKHI